MTVIPFRRVYEPQIEQPLGNGAREILIDRFGLTAPEADNMLACLWAEGFKLVPLTGDE